MNDEILAEYKAVRETGAGLFHFPGRGLVEVSGSEAEMFLDGLVTNGIKTLQEDCWMRAAFPNAQGRLLAVVRVWKLDGKYYFDTEEGTYQAVLNNLERFTLAGDFRVRDLSGEFNCYSVQGNRIPDLGFGISDSENRVSRIDFEGSGIVCFQDANIGANGYYFYVPETVAEKFRAQMHKSGVQDVSDEAFEVLRIESGLPLYGIDMDDTTVVPEIGLPDLISYTKGCYIGQEVIARIHFRGHVAKQLTGLVFEELSEPSAVADGLSALDLRSPDGKNAGRITSVAFSPKLGKVIALAYVRFAFLEEGTKLNAGDRAVAVKNLPFFRL